MVYKAINDHFPTQSHWHSSPAGAHPGHLVTQMLVTFSLNTHKQHSLSTKHTETHCRPVVFCLFMSDVIT